MLQFFSPLIIEGTTAFSARAATPLKKTFVRSFAAKLKAAAKSKQFRLTDNNLLGLSNQTIDGMQTDYLSHTLTTPNPNQDATFKRELTTLREETPVLVPKIAVSLVKDNHPHLIQPNLPETLRIESLRKAIRTYVEPPKRGIDFNAVRSFLDESLFMFRHDLNHQPLIRVLDAINNDKDTRRWFISKLRQKARKAPDRFWATGLHEWLPRNLIGEVLEGSAGFVVNKQPLVHTIDENAQVRTVDWLDIHSEARTPISRLYFDKGDGTISAAHTPALKKVLDTPGTTGSVTEGTHAFHQDLEVAFEESQSLNDFVKAAAKINTLHIVSGELPLKPTPVSYFTVEGLQTDKIDDLVALRQKIVLAKFERNRLFKKLDKITTPIEDSKKGPMP